MTFPNYFYPLALAIISLVVFALERFFAARPAQPALREGVGHDLLHLVFNGHLLGVIGYGVAAGWLLPGMERVTSGLGVEIGLGLGLAASWPVWLQIPVALFAVDLLQWCVHYMLHRVPWLWRTHQCHHSIRDGQLDWIAAFRFQWTEYAVYRVFLYVPLAWFGFGAEAMMTHAVVGTLIGHLNHANLPWGYGPLRFVFNSPKMHIWHHDYAAGGVECGNFGIIFSCWDWLFGTARMPEHPPERIGFAGDDAYPKDFAGQELWPLSRRMRPNLAWLRWGVVVLLVLGGLWLASHPLPGA